VSDDTKEQVIIYVVVFCLVGTILFLIDWLKRRRLVAKFRNLNPAVPLPLPYSIEYTSTCGDLIQGYEAERICRGSRADRWVLIILGWGWFILPFVVWLKVFPNVRADKWWQPLIPLILGAGLLWYHVAQPFLRRRRIRANNPSSQKLHLEFMDDGIQVHAEGIGSFKRTWDELAGVVNTKKGLLIYFIDGVVNWLPQRIFQSEEAKRSLFSFLYGHLPDDEESEQEPEH
jgi:hypothetical protein